MLSYFLFSVLFLLGFSFPWCGRNMMSSWPKRRTCAALLFALSSHCLQGEVLNSILLFLSFHSFTLDFTYIACFTWIQTLRTMLHLSLGVQEVFVFVFVFSVWKRRFLYCYKKFIFYNCFESLVHVVSFIFSCWIQWHKER